MSKSPRKRSRRRTSEVRPSHAQAVPSRPAPWPWIALAAVLCLGVSLAFFFITRPAQHGDLGRLRQADGDAVTLPPFKPLQSQRGVIALKEAEVALAQGLVDAFPQEDQAYVIMANMYHRQGDAIQAEQFRARALAINPRRADVYTGLAWHALKQGQFERAVTYYRQALSLEPSMRDAHNNMADALIKLARPQEALAVLKQGLVHDPQSSFAHYLMGQVLLQQEDFDTAAEHYGHAIRVEPRYASAYYGLATVCRRLGRPQEAADHMRRFRQLKTEERQTLSDRKREFEDYQEMQSNAAITHINAGRMYRDQGQPEKAEPLLLRAAGLDPNNVMCFLELASLYQARKQSARALQMHKRVRDLQPESAIPHLMIGILSAHLGHLEDAEQAFHSLIKLAPNKPEGYRELARLYLKTGKRIDEARQLAQKAVSIDGSAANYFVLGWAKDANGDVKGALPALRKAASMDPGNFQYAQLLQAVERKQ